MLKASRKDVIVARSVDRSALKKQADLFNDNQPLTHLSQSYLPDKFDIDDNSYMF